MSAVGRTRETGWATPKGDGRREAILDALRELLADKALAEISVGDLTARAGVTRSAFYFYFQTKSAAVLALLDELQDRMLELSQDWYEGGPGTAEQRLRSGMRASIAEWRAYATWFAAMIDATTQSAEAAGMWSAWIDAFVVRVTAVIERDAGARLRGIGAPSANALATGLVAMIFQLMERDVRSVIATGDGVPELEEILVHIWLNTIYGEHDGS